jgi:hypothetical protein
MIKINIKIKYDKYLRTDRYSTPAALLPLLC